MVIYTVRIVFICLEQKKLNLIKKYVLMPSEDTKILELNQYRKSD